MIKMANEIIAFRWSYNILTLIALVVSLFLQYKDKITDETSFVFITFFAINFIGTILSDVFYTVVLNAKDGDTEVLAKNGWV